MQISPGERGRHFDCVARSLLVVTLLLNLLLVGGAGTAEASPVNPIALGKAVVALNGPWKFHTGDDARWAEPDFDDSNWESVDLTPSAGSHDSDVGLTGYVSGWQTKGHRGYIGYAWYRVRVSIESPPGEGLALSGPPYVDSAYQVFLNGRLAGEFGDFSGATPAAYGVHRPKFFPLGPADVSIAQSLDGCVIAFRVLLFGAELNIFSFVGLILLVGLVKKNGIIMVDFALQVRRDRDLSAADAIVEACIVRFRPIMMTTVAAIIGALPIAMSSGMGAEARRPLGTVIVGGLVFSQLLTLYVTPALYVAVERLTVRVRPRIAHGHAA